MKQTLKDKIKKDIKKNHIESIFAFIDASFFYITTIPLSYQIMSVSYVNSFIFASLLTGWVACIILGNLFAIYSFNLAKKNIELRKVIQ